MRTVRFSLRSLLFVNTAVLMFPIVFHLKHIIFKHVRRIFQFVRTSWILKLKYFFFSVPHVFVQWRAKARAKAQSWHNYWGTKNKSGWSESQSTSERIWEGLPAHQHRQDWLVTLIYNSILQNNRDDKSPSPDFFMLKRMLLNGPLFQL